MQVLAVTSEIPMIAAAFVAVVVRRKVGLMVRVAVVCGPVVAVAVIVAARQVVAVAARQVVVVVIAAAVRAALVDQVSAAINAAAKLDRRHLRRH